MDDIWRQIICAFLQPHEISVLHSVDREFRRITNEAVFSLVYSNIPSYGIILGLYILKPIHSERFSFVRKLTYYGQEFIDLDQFPNVEAITILKGDADLSNRTKIKSLSIYGIGCSQLESLLGLKRLKIFEGPPLSYTIPDVVLSRLDYLQYGFIMPEYL